ncbi:MAG TPA: GntR family transcriptional regulator [Caulobacteraceae bacterium]|nr:GntR family transcriptional regulator [Caulobacteraceae bacterium]
MLDSLVVERSGVPIYVQVRDQLLRAIGAGALARGARMPTMRQVAVALKIDLNTVRHAYDDLERTGAIVLKQGLGSFVTLEPPPADPAARERTLDDLAGQAIAQAVAAGLNPISLAERIARLAGSQGA